MWTLVARLVGLAANLTATIAVHYVFPALEAPSERASLADGAGGKAPHVAGQRAGLSGRIAMEIWCGRWGGLSHRYAWKASANALCVAPAPREAAFCFARGYRRSDHCVGRKNGGSA